jgi:23S rRNA (uracil1939-C5)-methyltransferase
MARNSRYRAPERFRAEVERLDQEGRGVAHRDGKVVFIEGALPGELVDYDVLKSKSSYEVGRAAAILRESVLRVKPRCPKFGMGPGSCGGCAMQHLEPFAQVAFKEKVLVDTLWHIGKVRPERIIPPIYGPFWHYRHRARLAVRNVPSKGGVLVGFHEKNSSYVADMRACPVLPQKVSDLLPAMRELVASLSISSRTPQIEIAAAGSRTALVIRTLEPPTKDDMALIEAFGRDRGVDIWMQPGGPETAAPLHPEDEEALKLALPEFGVSISFKPTDFTQVNHELNERMVSRAVKLLGVEKHHKVADFFCGLGNFTLPLATRAARVIGIEGSEGLVARARRGAEENGLRDKTEFVARNLFTWSDADWKAIEKRLGGIDRVLIDPPREGALALARVLAAADQRPARVVYVSCNPATLARDCAILHHEGGWHIRAAGVMNMFPHTGHVESIAVLEPGEKPGEKSEEAQAIERRIAAQGDDRVKMTLSEE